MPLALLAALVAYGVIPALEACEGVERDAYS
jgi:hypothetical protein